MEIVLQCLKIILQFGRLNFPEAFRIVRIAVFTLSVIGLGSSESINLSVTFTSLEILTCDTSTLSS